VTNASIRLGSRVVNSESNPYVIAEIGVNHEGSLELAKHLVDLAKSGGADAAKFQTYKAETLASRHSPAYWDTTKEPTLSQFELFKKYDSFGEVEYRALAAHCQEVGVDFVSTPFDDAAVDLLAPLVPFFKVASFCAEWPRLPNP
jgi:N-acetylneuraminate synthase